LSALTIRPSKIPSFSRWAFGFVRAALTPGHYQNVVNAQSTLMERAYQAHLDEFVATPMNSGLRLGGTVELAGLEAPPNYKRTALLAKQLGTYFPSIETKERTDWMGHRPSLPDTMPVIGQSPSHENVIYAFGHPSQRSRIDRRGAASPRHTQQEVRCSHNTLSFPI
jgi:glycine/D-amino acid oxidase-like deaminating enzyme